MIKESKWMPAVLAALVLSSAVIHADSAIAPSDGELAAVLETPSFGVHNLLDLEVDSTAPGGAAVTLATDGEVSYETLVLDGPDRLVLDLQGVVSRLDRYKFAVSGSALVQVRAAQYLREPVPVTRVVFDLERPLGFSIDRNGSTLVIAFDDAGGATPVPELEQAEPGVAVPPYVAQIVNEMESRAIEPDLIERLTRGPAPLAAPAPAQPQGESELPPTFRTKLITGDTTTYTGQEISLNLVDADIKQIFRLFHEISGLNFVLDPGVSGKLTIVLDHVPWDQALDIILRNNGLDKELDRNVIRIASTKKLAQEAAARKQLREAEELEVDLVTITRTLSYAKAKDMERVFRSGGGGSGGLLSKRGRVIVDERTNTVIVTDIPKHIEGVDRLISTLDAETPQVMIEARVVETSRDFVRDLGVVWGLEAFADAAHGTSTGLNFPHNASVKYGLNLPGEGGASNLAFKFGNVIDSFTLDVALNALETEGAARVLSSPKIATQNNERAEIEQGVRIPIVNTTATEINVEFVSASLKMSVTPQITAEGTIILDVIVENNSPDFVNTAGGIPSIRTQRAQTKVLISDGGTTVIGGIFTVNEGRSEVGVPWFRKIPVFGWLFKSQNVTNQNRELLIFITPKIMRLS